MSSPIPRPLERRLDVTLPPKKSVTSVLEKADTIDYYCRER